jgi:hypothetical protein
VELCRFGLPWSAVPEQRANNLALYIPSAVSTIPKVLFNEAKLSIFPLENSPQGVAALPEEELTPVLARVRHFDEFTADNDPPWRA